ncbi:hypothetical protein [Candidatus Hodarchaeum mangrovi]
MQELRDSKRVLIIGYEVGSLVRSIKSKFPDIQIGSVDLMGNLEVRKYANWKFSVVKQAVKEEISTPDQRSIDQYLFELTLIMIEEIEFDFLIACSPFHRDAKQFSSIANNIKNSFPFKSTTQLFLSDYDFFKKIREESIIQSNFIIQSASELEIIETNPIIFLCPENSFYIPSQAILQKIQKNYSGITVPASRIHSIAFMKSQKQVICLGLQTLVEPNNHQFLLYPLEKNALFPFITTSNLTQDSIINSFKRIIHFLEITGFYTIYFTIKDNELFPFSIVPTFDENFRLWELKLGRSIIQSFIKDTFNRKIKSYGLKLPIYFPNSKLVPKIPFRIASHISIPGTYSHPHYPICKIFEVASTVDKLQHRMNKRKKILYSRFGSE